MYECHSPDGRHRVITDFYGEACLYHSLGYTVYDWTMTMQRAKNAKPRQVMHRAQKRAQ